MITNRYNGNRHGYTTHGPGDDAPPAGDESGGEDLRQAIIDRLNTMTNDDIAEMIDEHDPVFAEQFARGETQWSVN